MKLIVHELDTSLFQEVRTDWRYHQVTNVRPHVYRHDSPAGTVKVQIQDSDENLIAESASRTIADIGEGTYWHGYANFEVAAQLEPDTVYRVVLVAAGYTFGESAYLGWCNGFDLNKYDASYSPSSGFNAPLDVEIWHRKHERKGRI